MLFVTARSLACWKGTLTVVVKTLSTSFPPIFLKFSTSFPFQSSDCQESLSKIKHKSFSQGTVCCLVCAWALCPTPEWNTPWPALGSLLLHPLHAWPEWQEKSMLHSKLELSTCERILYHRRKVIPQRTNCATMWNFNILYTHDIHALDGFRQPPPTKQQTNPHESQNLSGWPRNSTTVKPLQVAKKAETHTHVDGIMKP